MIQNYTKPQLTIRQVLQTQEGLPTERMNALVVGPQYTVADAYTNNSEHVFSTEGDTVGLSFVDELENTWNPALDNISVEEDSLRLFANEVEARLVDGDGYLVGTGTRQSPTEIKFSSPVRDVTGSNIYSSLKGRNIQLGDIVRVSVEGGAEQLRTVVGFTPAQVSAATIGAPAAGLANTTTQATAATDVISSPANYDSVSDLTLVETDDARAIRELGMRFLQGGLYYLGDIFSLTITAFDPLNDDGTFSFSTASGAASGTGTYALNSGTTYDFSIVVTSPSGAIATLEGSFTLAVGEVPAVGDKLVIKYFAARAAAPTSVISASGTYTGTSQNVYYVLIKEFTDSDEVEVEVRDGLSRFAPVTSTVDISAPTTSTFVLVDGVTIEIDLAVDTFAKGDLFMVTATPAILSGTSFDGVILSAPVAVPPTSGSSFPVQADFRKKYTGYIDTPEFGTSPVSLVTGGQAAYVEGITIFEPRRSEGFQNIPLVDEVGHVSVHYRALVAPQPTEKTYTVSSLSDAEELFGPAKLTNDLSFAVKQALSGAQGKQVFVLRTNGTDATAFSAALKKVERNDLVYAIAVVTDDLGAIRAVADHCDAMSAPTIKNFRRCYYGTDVPDEFVILDRNPDNLPYEVNVSLVGGAPLLVQFQGTSPQLETLDILPGDFLEMFGDKYPIAEVINANELLLSSGPQVPTSGNARIIKPNTTDNAIIYVSSRSKAIDSRRAANIWCDYGLGYDRTGTLPVAIPSRFIAAEIAGLRSALVPWLGLTRTEIDSVNLAPLMYNKYTDEDLNKAAANGTFIITQEMEGGPVFVRHQLTTSVSSGILYYEDSVGANIDRLSFSFKDTLDPLIGKTNVNRETLAIIHDRAFEILKAATQTTALSLVGPQLISFFNEAGEQTKVTVRVHPTFKDRVILKVRVEPPVPLNGIDAEIEAQIGLTL